VDRQEAKREIDDGFVQTCEQELARLVGPIAHFIVTSQRSAHAHASREEFVACLSGEIPDATKAAAFRQRIAVGDP
jgi:serine/threonine-protein kinase